MRSLADVQFKMEKSILSELGPEKPLHNLVNKDYRNMQKERDLFKKKQRDLEIASSKYQKEKEKRDNVANDYLYKDMLESKQQRYNQSITYHQDINIDYAEPRTRWNKSTKKQMLLSYVSPPRLSHSKPRNGRSPRTCWIPSVHSSNTSKTVLKSSTISFLRQEKRCLPLQSKEFMEWT